ncbi:uncharacterized protein LOC143035117 [Oratosquilla oratoria]|uniref:uncharacterized protein LOC143035117 n=1 Tax=Oratosquilla oratoria TaxID=337810 RepID=UPI003F769714
MAKETKEIRKENELMDSSGRKKFDAARYAGSWKVKRELFTQPVARAFDGRRSVQERDSTSGVRRRKGSGTSREVVAGLMSFEVKTNPASRIWHLATPFHGAARLTAMATASSTRLASPRVHLGHCTSPPSNEVPLREPLQPRPQT